VTRSQHCFAMLNAFPYNNGHIMIIPDRHVADLGDLSDREMLDIHHTLIKVKTLLTKNLAPQGFNVGINLGKTAGAGIDKHIHVHIVPRWDGDTNFMPVTANVKIISQSLGELYKKLTVKEKTRKNEPFNTPRLKNRGVR